MNTSQALLSHVARRFASYSQELEAQGLFREADAVDHLMARIAKDYHSENWQSATPGGGMRFHPPTGFPDKTSPGHHKLPNGTMMIYPPEPWSDEPGAPEEKRRNKTQDQNQGLRDVALRQKQDLEARRDNRHTLWESHVLSRPEDFSAGGQTYRDINDERGLYGQDPLVHPFAQAEQAEPQPLDGDDDLD